MKIGNDPGFGLNVAILKNSNVADEPVQSEVDGAVREVLTGHQARKSLMAGNFVHMNSERSRYIQGTMIGLQVQNDFKNKMDAVVSQYKLQAQAADSYAEKALAGQKTARAMGETVKGEVSEKETDRMAKEREEDEARIEERQTEKAEEKKAESKDAEAAGDETVETKAAPGESKEVPKAEAVPVESKETPTVKEEPSSEAGNASAPAVDLDV
ncbi:hypothetical protein [Pseudodesulfovibrio sp.]|uniref:hypothetical protein n=1 Tax=unclassified Pseudodesulfovibrio TaxID=2661612 RepID=UPI003AFFB97D